VRKHLKTAEFKNHDRLPCSPHTLNAIEVKYC
jgi:hypothetical protein